MRHTTCFTSFSPAPTGERRTLPALRWLGQAIPKLLLGRLHAHLGVELDLLVLGLGGRGARDIAVTTPHDDPSELREAMCRLLGLVVWVGVIGLGVGVGLVRVRVRGCCLVGLSGLSQVGCTGALRRCRLFAWSRARGTEPPPLLIGQLFWWRYFAGCDLHPVLGARLG